MTGVSLEGMERPGIAAAGAGGAVYGLAGGTGAGGWIHVLHSVRALPAFGKLRTPELLGCSSKSIVIAIVRMGAKPLTHNDNK